MTMLTVDDIENIEKGLDELAREDQEDYIRKLAPTTKDRDLVHLFNKQFDENLSLAAFRKRRQRLGVAKASGRPKNGT